MDRCSVKPYEGQEDYIFISYAHKDKDMVFPVIERLARDGYRIWYDEGIDPGSEWPESIAVHLDQCAVCIAFLSENSLNSHNCRREINFALSRQKPLLTIFLESVKMSLGMEMQLSVTQSVSMYTIPEEELFYEKIYSAKFLESCRKPPAPEPEPALEPVPEPEPAPTPEPIPESEPAPVPEPMPAPEPAPAPIPDPPAPIAEPVLTPVPRQEPEPFPLTPPPRAHRKRRFPAVIAVAALAAVAAAAGFLLFGHGGSVTVCGEKYNADETSVYLTEQTVTRRDLEALASMKELTGLSLNSCTIDAESYSLPGTLTSLRLTECTGLSAEALAPLDQLNFLYLTDCGLKESDLSALELENKAQLWTLDLSGNEISDLSLLQPAAGSLNTLNLDRTGAADLSPLASFEKLSTLRASGNGISDLSPLKDTSIQSLVLDDNQISDLTPLGAASKLVDLSVSGNQLSDLRGLENSINLTDIRAANNQLTSLKGLENCTILEDVDLTGNQLIDISLLEKSAGTLETVYLGGNRILRLSALTCASALQSLSLDGNLVSDLEPLRSASALQRLSANDNSITSIDALSGMSQLTYLYLARNDISDMSPIARLAAAGTDDIYALDLSGNHISQLTLPESKKISYLDISGNPLTSLQGLSGITGSRLLFSYASGMDLSGISSNYYNFSVLDCPLDHQVAVKDTLKENYATVEFQSAEDAQQIMAGTRPENLP